MPPLIAEEIVFSMHKVSLTENLTALLGHIPLQSDVMACA
jgi:hypothetical protein